MRTEPRAIEVTPELLGYILDRIVVDEKGCWVWQKGTNKDGYGVFGYEGRFYTPHRVMWFYSLRGEIPQPGLEPDHTCRNRKCCNPACLEGVTRSVNTKRGYNVLGWRGQGVKKAIEIAA